MCLKVYVVLPAAGNGTRFGGDVPKQFVEVLDKPIICYTIESIHNIDWIEQIIIPVPSNWMDFAVNLKLKYSYGKVLLVNGEKARHRSIFTGIKALPDTIRSDDIIIIHDAVRPFLREDFLKKVVETAQLNTACGAVKSLVSTIVKSSVDGYLMESLQRSDYRESHTPQAFHYDCIKNAYLKCTADDFENGTETLHIVLKYCKVKAKLLDGPDYLWKVTHENDVKLMEAYLKL